MSCFAARPPQPSPGRTIDQPAAPGKPSAVRAGFPVAGCARRRPRRATTTTAALPGLRVPTCKEIAPQVDVAKAGHPAHALAALTTAAAMYRFPLAQRH